MIVSRYLLYVILYVDDRKSLVYALLEYFSNQIFRI